jgi:hypothetical protein
MYRPLIAWAQEQIALLQSGAVDLPEIARKGLAKFGTDPEFLRTEVYELIYTQLKYVMATTRGTQRALGSTTTTLIRWREHTSRGYLLLTEMTRIDLKEAIAERIGIVQEQERRVKFLSALRKGLTDDRMTVGQRFDAEQIESLRRRYVEGTAAAEEREEAHDHAPQTAASETSEVSAVRATDHRRTY